MMVADEEAGGAWGTGWLLEHRPELAGHACLIGEPESPDGVRIGEKGKCQFRLVAEGASRHGGLGTGDDVVIRIGAALPDPRYAISDTSGIISPAVVIFRDLVEANLAEMIRVAGSAGRLRPHCKTHKMREVAQLELERGIRKHKCATLAEAEMLAQAGAKDVFLAYNLVGANIGRAVEFRRKFPAVALSVTADHSKPIEMLGAAMKQAGLAIDVLLDIDPGLHRTGLEPGPQAKALYQQLAERIWSPERLSQEAVS